MSHRDTSPRRLGLQAIEDRTALAAGLSSALQAAALAPAPAPMQVQYANDDVALASTAGNDPRFGEQWDLKNTGQDDGTAGADIGVTRAWDVTKGSTAITVSVMDTGIDYTHQDLYLNIWLNQGEIPANIRSKLIDTDGDKKITFRDLNDSRNKGAGKITDLNGNGYIDGGDVLKPTSQGGWADGVSNDGDKYVDDLLGWDFVDNDNNPMDTHGHGTHIAGTIGAIGNNGVGVSGINWVSQIMAIRFVDGTGGGSISGFIDGLNYAVAHGAKLSNNSWTAPSASDLLTAAVNNARAKGHVLVCAAGNAGDDNDVTPNFPATFTQSNVVAVAATDHFDKLAGYSNYGKTSVDIAAPGDGILSTKLGGGYYFNSGTSMATPHVTGALALVWAKNPTWTYDKVIAQVLNTADRLPSLTGKVVSGRLNVGAAVGAATALASAPRVVNAVSVVGGSTSIEQIRVSFDRAMAASSFATGDVILTGPGGTVAVAKVAPAVGYGANVYDITFAKQTRGGTYTLKVGPDVKDTAGNQMTAYQKAFTLTTPVPSTSGTPHVVNAVSVGGSSTSLLMIRVSFDRPMVTSTFTPADVTLTGPGGTIAVAKVAQAVGYGANVYDITFAKQTRGGTYTLKVGPDVKDSSGKQMALFQKAFTLTTPAPVPSTSGTPHVVNAVSVNGSSTSLQMVRVSFDRSMVASTFTTGDVTLAGPGGTIAITKVTQAAGYGPSVYDITFAKQTRGGTYTLRVGPDIKDLGGKQMATFQKAFTLAQAPTPTTESTKVYLSSVKATVGPLGRGVSMITVPDAATVTDVNVEINITHPNTSDLSIQLQAPDGTTILLVNRKGGSSKDFVHTKLDDQATTPVGFGVGPFTGSYKPDVPLSTLVGKAAKGAWKLWVVDRAGAHSGALDGWSLTIKGKA